MRLILSEEQELLASSASSLLQKEYEFQAQRKRAPSTDGCDGRIWRLFAQMGWLGLPLPAEFGGFEAGSVGTGVLLEAMGRHLVVEPYLACVVLSACLIAEQGTPAQRQEWLPGIVEGRRRVALAHAPRSSGSPWDIPATSAVRLRDGWRLEGGPLFVEGAVGAGGLLVTARFSPPGEAGGIRLFLLDGAMSGLRFEPAMTADGIPAADVTVNGLQLKPGHLLGTDSDAGAVLRRVCAQAIVASCWEACGAMTAAYEQTVAYTLQRRQFGQPLAQFQVVSHRLAEMAVCCTEARAACELASLSMERGDAEPCMVASTVKVKVGRCADYVSKEAVQLHGAIGMTNELPIASYFRKLTAFNARGGGPQLHARSLGQSLLASGTWRQSRTLAQGRTETA